MTRASSGVTGATNEALGLHARPRGYADSRAVRRRIAERLRRYAEQHFAGCYTRLETRFHGQFCYIDAYTEPAPPPAGWPPADWPETREEYLERLRNTPTHLCRLRYFGDQERWGFAFYTYSNERYELSVFPSGEFSARPRRPSGLLLGPTFGERSRPR